VSVRSHLDNHTAKLYQILCMLHVAVTPFSSDGFPIGDTVYFRFCGWRRVFTQRALWCVACIPKRRERNSWLNLLHRFQPNFAQR